MAEDSREWRIEPAGADPVTVRSLAEAQRVMRRCLKTGAAAVLHEREAGGEWVRVGRFRSRGPSRPWWRRLPGM